MKLPFVQHGTLIHDQERFIAEILDGQTSDAKPIEVGSPNWNLMMKYGTFIVRACNAHDDLVAVLLRCRDALGSRKTIVAKIDAALAKAEAKP